MTSIRISYALIQRRVRIDVHFQLAQMIVRVELMENGFKLLQMEFVLVFAILIIRIQTLTITSRMRYAARHINVRINDFSLIIFNYLIKQPIKTPTDEKIEHDKK